MYEYKVNKVIKIIDGDTIDIEIDLGFSISIRQRIRLADIDAPETRTLDIKEKEKGILAKEWLEEHLKDKELIIKTIKEEKYGRMLGYLYIKDDHLSINYRMILEGFVKKYK
jgi:micrococcal nuclease